MGACPLATDQLMKGDDEQKQWGAAGDGGSVMAEETERSATGVVRK